MLEYLMSIHSTVDALLTARSTIIDDDIIGNAIDGLDSLYKSFLTFL